MVTCMFSARRGLIDLSMLPPVANQRYQPDCAAHYVSTRTGTRFSSEELERLRHAIFGDLYVYDTADAAPLVPTKVVRAPPMLVIAWRLWPLEEEQQQGQRRAGRR